MNLSELEQKISEHRRRITEIGALLNRGHYNTIEQAGKLRLESQQLKDALPLLEKEFEKIKVSQKDKAQEAARRRLKRIGKESRAIQLAIMEIQIDLIRKLTRLRTLQREAGALIRPFKELRPLTPQIRLTQREELLNFVKAELRSPRELWKKVEQERREAYKAFRKV